MRKKNIGAIAVISLAPLVALVAARQAPERDADQSAPYTKMAPIEQYLMDRTAEIALARSGAPESISSDADILVLGRRGFETALKGKNNFVCVVERSWTSAPDADFWNPKVRTPICYNAPAVRSVLVRNLKRTDMILAGRTQAQTDEAIFAGVDKKELPAMEPGAICYMMSKQGYGGDSVPHWPSHLMFFFPQTDPAIWGANLTGSPVIAVSDDHEHVTTFVITVQRWSDGTEAR